MGGPCDYRVSPRSKSFFFSFFGGLLFDLGACWDQDLDQGLTILNKEKIYVSERNVSVDSFTNESQSP